MINKINAYGICLYKKTKKSYEILLCKSVLSRTKYGFLKGMQDYGESIKQTAIREFYEESSIKVEVENLEKYFLQENNYKDIGIYMVNYKNIKNIDSFFISNNLKKKYICSENSNVGFFDIKNLPTIKDKQITISKDIVKYLQSQNS